MLPQHVSRQSDIASSGDCQPQASERYSCNTVFCSVQSSFELTCAAHPLKAHTWETSTQLQQVLTKAAAQHPACDRDELNLCDTHSAASQQIAGALHTAQTFANLLALDCYVALVV